MNKFDSSSTGATSKPLGIKDLSLPYVPDKSEVNWSEVTELKSELKPVPVFSFDLLPSPIREYVKDTSYRMQCPPDYIAVAVLTTLSSVIGAGCSIRPKAKDNWSVVPNLWGVVVAPPGAMKTPALSAGINLLSCLEEKARDDHLKELKEHEADKVIFAANKSALEAEAKALAKPGKKQADDGSLEDIKQKLINLEEPTKPQPRRYKTNDSTVAKITELHQANPRGLLVSRDEVTGLLAQLDREDRAEDKAFYLEAWNGSGSYTTDRIKRGTTVVKNLCLAVLGGIQPDKLLPYLSRVLRSNNNDGLFQRFQLAVYPDKTTWKLVDEEPDQEAKSKLEATLCALANSEFCNLGATLEEGTDIPFFRLDEQAQELFNNWLTQLHTQKLQEEDEGIIVEHLSKYRSLLPSLALVFHLVSTVNSNKPSSVGVSSIELAIQWCQYLEQHARRIYGQLACISLKAAIKLQNHIKRKNLEDGFSIRDVQRKGWQYLDSREVVIDACEILIDSGFLREERLHSSPSGGPQRVIYRVHPKFLG